MNAQWLTVLAHAFSHSHGPPGAVRPSSPASRDAAEDPATVGRGLGGRADGCEQRSSCGHRRPLALAAPLS